MNRLILATMTLGLLASPLTAHAATSITGTFNGATWIAQNRIVGVNSTATVAGGGDSRYFATDAKYKGVAALIMTYNGIGSFICTGSLLNDRKSIVTAGHCVTNGPTLQRPDVVTAYFYGGEDPDVIVSNSALATAVAVSDIIVNSNYTGQVIDENDIAVLQLAQLAPAFATSYDLFGGRIDGEVFNVAGYGQRSTGGGAVGANAGTGRRRQGNNIYDVAWGDADWQGFFTDPDASGYGFFDDNTGAYAPADYANSWVSDFDNGLIANNATCELAGAFGLGGAKYCNLGVGVKEVGVAGGDSGGPQFVNGEIASITSYGLSFGTGFGDIDGNLNSTYGEFSGYVPIYLHTRFIALAQAVPEPSTWAMMITGFGLVGGSMRVRRRAVSFA